MNTWLDEQAAAQQDTDNRVMTVLMGLAVLFAVTAVINAVVIAAADRRAEFAAARIAGFTRAQVVRTALIESWAVALIGLTLGGLAAAVAAAAAAGATGALTMPWALAGTIALGALLVIGATSVTTTLAATHLTPISLIAARE